MSALATRLAYRGQITVRYAPVRGRDHHQAAAWPDLQAWLRWRKIGGASDRTLDTYERVVAKLLLMFPAVEFGAFKEDHLLALLETYPPRSRHINKAALSSWFKWGYQQRRIDANPVDRLPTIRYQASRVIELFTPAEQAALCSLPTPDGQLMTILFGTGLRQTEARLLTGKRLDLDGRQVIVREGAKGKRDRTVPMMRPVAQAAAELFLLEGVGDGEHVWYDRPVGDRSKVLRRSKPIGSSSFHRWWVRCTAAAGVRPLKPHTTRHCFATNMRRMGLAVEEVQLLLGHASYKTTADQYISSDVELVGLHMLALAEAGEAR